ncbi:MAG: UDP-N-acetylmuramoyl-L-alanyl-D-glutamate--2,6-diaminopimelate ligase [Rhodospirillales bacterium]|nr:UDP-N-acetylmuramoyl-L-alanyl-D-glutamate--2,6-diaminopimelate ligase [Alphaproteobacteria bacterium]MBL6947295.1 UDP-N-acetylmuramoyl-L-alanyl-D-glutamate--2,6-diaminopimelate ligase [Rhodospirillales bacterium]
MEVTDQTVGNETEIIGLTCDSRQVEPGFIFAALPGTLLDGRDYIAEALEKGASCVLALPGTVLPDDALDPWTGAPVPLVVHAEPRRQYALMAAAFYETQPEIIAAVTGTNGKTSVVTFLRQIWTGLGFKAASTGTLGVVARGFENRKTLTTPDCADLHRNLRDLARFGVTRMALEASSHGLEQHRLDGVRVSIAAFTNLSRDHLDYHGSMGEYLAAKLRLFTNIITPGGTAVINSDADFAGDVEAACRDKGLRVMTYGGPEADVSLEASEVLANGYRLEISAGGARHRVILPLMGDFQISNALAAAALAIASGEDAGDAIAQLEHLEGAPGRLQLVGETPKGAPVFVDYAHTPDALSSVLGALRSHTSKRLHVVFGCGGDRDAGKRPDMGAIAAELADVVIVTDDNPRTEDAQSIRAQILSAIPGAMEIADREEAIREAIHGLETGDLLVIAGKGHEKGQIIGTQTRPFDDMQIARDILRKLPE